MLLGSNYIILLDVLTFEFILVISFKSNKESWTSNSWNSWELTWWSSCLHLQPNSSNFWMPLSGHIWLEYTSNFSIKNYLKVLYKDMKLEKMGIIWFHLIPKYLMKFCNFLQQDLIYCFWWCDKGKEQNKLIPL